jgi:hypothetical protein
MCLPIESDNTGVRKRIGEARDPFASETV